MYFQFAQLPPPKYSSEEGKMIESTALYQKASCSMHFNPSGKSIGLSFTSPPKASSSITITLLGIFTVSNKGHQDAKQNGIVSITFGNPYFLQCQDTWKKYSLSSFWTVFGRIASIMSLPAKAAISMLSKPFGKFTSATLVL